MSDATRPSSQPDDVESPAAQKLRSLINLGGKSFEAPIEHHACIDSTNRRLKDWARAGAPDRSVVIADKQTAGRGRHGHGWISPRGNVCLSLLIRGQWLASQPQMASLAGGVAVAGALEHFGVQPRLKWPNDVLVGGRKIAGVLAESVISSRGADAVIVGVGVNVNLVADEAPGLAFDRVTSLRIETRSTNDTLAVAAAVLIRMGECYDALARQEAERLREEWHRLAVPWWGRLVEIEAGGERIRGVMEALDASGALVLRMRDGSARKVHAGEVRELRRPQEDER